MTHLKPCLALSLCLALPGLALAADEDPDKQAVHVRHALMEVMGWNMGSIGMMATGKQPYEQAEAAKRGRRVAALAEMIGDAFARDTSGADLRTEALPAVWQNPEDFAAKALALAEAAQAYTAATGESEAAARQAFVKLGGACKACHEKYKAE